MQVGLDLLVFLRKNSQLFCLRSPGNPFERSQSAEKRLLLVDITVYTYQKS